MRPSSFEPAAGGGCAALDSLPHGSPQSPIDLARGPAARAQVKPVPLALDEPPHAMEEEQPTLEKATAQRLVRRHTVSVSQLSPPSSPPRLSVRRPSLSASALPPLDFSALPDPASTSSASLCTARRAVDAITAALSRVRPFLYVTGAAGARDLQALYAAGATHVINLAGATTANFHGPPMRYLRVCARDDVREDLSVVFDDAVAFIDAAREARSSVAVHCHMGISRSVTIVAAYLIMMEGMTAEAALSEVRHSRPVADPNTRFVASLNALQKRVRSGLTDPVLFRVQPLAPTIDGSYLVPVPFIPESRDPQAMPDDGAWILALPARGGFEVVLGARAPEQACARAVELATTMARHEERYEEFFPVATADGDLPGVSVTVSTPPVQTRRLRGLQKRILQRHILRETTPSPSRTPFKCSVRVHDRPQWSVDMARRLVDAAVDGIVH